MSCKSSTLLPPLKVGHSLVCMVAIHRPHKSTGWQFLCGCGVRGLACKSVTRASAEYDKHLMESL